MNLTEIASSVVWIDFFTIALSKVFHLGKSLDKWYANFGIIAVISDCLVIILGIMIAQFIAPGANILTLTGLSIVIQILHDVLFYYAVILGVPHGQNSMIDLFKEYAVENSWKILIADSAMVGFTVLLAGYLSKLRPSHTTFIGLLGVYGLTYIMFTK